MIKNMLTICFVVQQAVSFAQIPVGLNDYSDKNGAKVSAAQNIISVTWPAGKQIQGRMQIDLNPDKPLFRSIGIKGQSTTSEIGRDLNPVFLLTVGKRDLVSQNGWNIFFDKVPLKPFKSHVVALNKKSASVSSTGSRTVITISELTAPDFSGTIEITLYNGSPLFNVAAVISTMKDSTAILYDAGLTSKRNIWKNISFTGVTDKLKMIVPGLNDTSRNETVKYRMIIGSTEAGSMALFASPHQYFYPLDEAFNLKFVWHGNDYRKMTGGYGIGIRQDLYGDKRFVPWFNSPPGTFQRLNFSVY